MIRSGGAADGRIPLSLRIGVVGHRWVPDGDPAVTAVLAGVLARLRASLPDTASPTSVTIVSSLADGADRLLLQGDTSDDTRLEAVLPVDAARYRTDFTAESAVDFDGLLAQASTVVIAADSPGDLAYRAAARAVVDRSDVLVALWDGLPSRGPGGTAETVEYARRAGRPVWWLQVTGGAGDVVVADRGAPDLPPLLSTEALAGLERFNRSDLAASSPPLDAAYARADRLALASQSRLLRMTRANYVLAVVAVTVQAAEITFHPRVPWLPAVEFLALTIVAVQILAIRRGRLLDRWTSSRYLAERLRAASALVAVGIAPVTRSERIELIGDPDIEWATRALLEVTRRVSADRRDPELASARTRLAEGWLGEQIGYHRRTAARYERLDRVGFAVTLGLFVASVACSAVHIVLSVAAIDLDPDWLAFVALVVPASAAAVGAYVAQREFRRQSARSVAVGRELRVLADRIAAAPDVETVRQHAILADRLLGSETGDWYAVQQFREPELP